MVSRASLRVVGEGVLGAGVIPTTALLFCPRRNVRGRGISVAARRFATDFGRFSGDRTSPRFVRRWPERRCGGWATAEPSRFGLEGICIGLVLKGAPMERRGGFSAVRGGLRGVLSGVRGCEGTDLTTAVVRVGDTVLVLDPAIVTCVVRAEVFVSRRKQVGPGSSWLPFSSATFLFSDKRGMVGGRRVARGCWCSQQVLGKWKKAKPRLEFGSKMAVNIM